MKLPQRCPNPECAADLTDPTVPEDLRAEHQESFSMVKLLANDGQRARFQCPVCGHTWILGSPRKKKSKSGNPAKRNA